MGSERHIETERKYDVSTDCVTPDLTRLPDVCEVAAPLELGQVATYFDTPDLRLLSAGVTLRRRTGGVDDGWHVKLPLPGEQREEVRRPLGDDAVVPGDLLDLVRIHVRDTPVGPVAVLSTRRLVHRLLGDDGAVLAELCDDHVLARTSSDAPTLEEWREWELELVDGPAGLLDAADPLLRAAGARPAVASSKLAHVLAESLPPRPVWRDRVPLGRKPSTADLLSTYLAEHLVRLEEQDQQLRRGDQEGVHQLRVAARRIRSALSTYAPVLEPDPTRWLGDELKWLGGVLSEARDAQVLRQRLDSLVRDQPEDLVIGPVVARIDAHLQEKFRTGRADADDALGSTRYFRLVDRLEEFVGDVPVTDDADVPARRKVSELVGADLERVRKRHRAVRRAGDSGERDLALHEVRKAAKRLRYAAESARPVFGKRAKRLAARAEAVQELLGEHQDTVVARTGAA